MTAIANTATITVACLFWLSCQGCLFTQEPTFKQKYTQLIPELLQLDAFRKINISEWPSGNNGYVTPFPCNITQCTTKPSSVHRLRPCHVDVTAAMGDSITAAFGAKAKNLITLFLEYRGISWTIGGDEDLEHIITLPNILKKYNSKLTGFSVKITPPLIPIPWKEHLDVAVSGAISSDLPGQAQDLINKLKRNSIYDYKNTWKVLTIFIGGNDLCAICKNSKHTPEKYIAGIRDALDLLHQEVPKMFVNIIQILDVTRLRALTSLYCRSIHVIVCLCATSCGKSWERKVSKMTLAYQKLVRDLVNSGRYDTKDDFTVVIQPFLTGTTIPRLPDGEADRSYFAPDCFHFSSKSHAAGALGLWNNMLEPVGMKRTIWSLTEKFECPKKDFPYFFTRNNSDEYLKSLHHRDQRANGAQKDTSIRGQKALNMENLQKRVIEEEKMVKKASNIPLTATLAVSGLLCLILLTFIAYASSLWVRKIRYRPLLDESTSSIYGAMN